MAKARDKSSVTVADVIEHLKTLPQDMEVWVCWDEGGCYYPTKNKRQACVQEISLQELHGSRRRRKEWMDPDMFSKGSRGKIKKVCVLNESWKDKPWFKESK